MATDIKLISDPNSETCVSEVAALALQGYEIDLTNAPWVGLTYNVTMVKDDRRAVEMAERIISGTPPKMTPAERMAKARAARGQGKKEEA